MEIKIAIAKATKYAVSDSGDSVEVVERPHGGISAILADGQGSGRAAKLTSSQVVNKAAALIADGTRDGAVARAVHDYLYALKGGKVSSTLTLISADLDTQTVVISRNANCPVLVRHAFGITVYDEDVNPIGVHKKMKPLTGELEIEPGLLVVTYTDGIQTAGKKTGRSFDRGYIMKIMEKYRAEDADYIAEAILSYGLELDQGRPGDDMSVLVMAVYDREMELKVKRFSVTFPY